LRARPGSATRADQHHRRRHGVNYAINAAVGRVVSHARADVPSAVSRQARDPRALGRRVRHYHVLLKQKAKVDQAEKKPEEQWQHEHHLDDFGALLGFA
jgi:hypothetical protein